MVWTSDLTEAQADEAKRFIDDLITHHSQDANERGPAWEWVKRDLEQTRDIAAEQARWQRER